MGKKMSNKENKIEILKQESQRRELVKKTKILGKQIEEIEKDRISKDIDSIQYRIMYISDLTLKTIQDELDRRKKDKKLDKKPCPDFTKTCQKFIETYKSIRKDICYTIEKREKNFQDKFIELFPEAKISDNSFNELVHYLHNAINQLIQIKLFLDRYK